MTNIIIVNFNNWKDTIICLESLRTNILSDFRIVVIDNASIDDSCNQIEKWFKNQEIFGEFYPKWKNYICQSIELNYEIISSENLCVENVSSNYFLIKSTKNNGFSYGNNLGINLTKEFKDNQYFWFLNNDTYIEKDTLDNLITYFNSGKYGLIGSKLLNYEHPHSIQALYGHFNAKMGKNTVIKDLSSNLTITYPIGASLFTSGKILDLVGNFDENYFLYYEELDLSFRIKKLGYEIGFSKDSIVYHKQGASTNSKQDKRKRNLFVIKVSYQSLIKFYKKNIPEQIFGAYLYLFRQSISSLLKLEINRSILAFKTIFYKP